MAGPGMQTFRGIVSASDCDHHGHMMMSGWAGAVSDALLGAFAAAGLALSEADAAAELVEIEQRIQVLAPVDVGESIEIMSGVVAVSPQGLTVAHLVLAVSAERSKVARCWSVAAQADADGNPGELSAAVMQKLEHLRVAESEIFGE